MGILDTADDQESEIEALQEKFESSESEELPKEDDGEDLTVEIIETADEPVFDADIDLKTQEEFEEDSPEIEELTLDSLDESTEGAFDLSPVDTHGTQADLEDAISDLHESSDDGVQELETSIQALKSEGPAPVEDFSDFEVPEIPDLDGIDSEVDDDEDYEVIIESEDQQAVENQLHVEEKSTAIEDDSPVFDDFEIPMIGDDDDEMEGEEENAVDTSDEEQDIAESPVVEAIEDVEVAEAPVEEPQEVEEAHEVQQAEINGEPPLDVVEADQDDRPIAVKIAELQQKLAPYRRIYDDSGDLKIKTRTGEWTLSLPYFDLSRKGTNTRALLDVENFIGLHNLALKGVVEVKDKLTQGDKNETRKMLAKLQMYFKRLYGNIHQLMGAPGEGIFPYMGDDFDPTALLQIETNVNLGRWETLEDLMAFKQFFDETIANPFREFIQVPENRYEYFASIMKLRV